MQQPSVVNLGDIIRKNEAAQAKMDSNALTQALQMRQLDAAKAGDAQKRQVQDIISRHQQNPTNAISELLSVDPKRAANLESVRASQAKDNRAQAKEGRAQQSFQLDQRKKRQELDFARQDNKRKSAAEVRAIRAARRAAESHGWDKEKHEQVMQAVETEYGIDRINHLSESLAAIKQMPKEQQAAALEGLRQEERSLFPGESLMDQVDDINDPDADAFVARYEFKNPDVVKRRQERQSKIDKANKSKSSRDLKGNIVIEDLGRAIDIAENSNFATGVFGAALGNIPTSDAANLQKMLKTVQASIGFDELQRMRDSSPTGGALGAINQSEMELLQSVLGSIDTTQSKDQLLYNLRRIESVYQSIIHGPDGVQQQPNINIQQQAQSTPQQQPQGQPVRRKFNPATGRIE